MSILEKMNKEDFEEFFEGIGLKITERPIKVRNALIFTCKPIKNDPVQSSILTKMYSLIPRTSGMIMSGPYDITQKTLFVDTFTCVDNIHQKDYSEQYQAFMTKKFGQIYTKALNLYNSMHAKKHALADKEQ